MPRFTLFIICFSLLCGIINSTAGACALDKEKQALDIRVLQSYMMVAALSCEQQENYNKVMVKFSDYFLDNSKIMRKYFARLYGRQSDNKLNNFITYIANESSRQSLQIEDSKFCLGTAKTFNKILKSDHKNLLKIANKFSGIHNVLECQDLAKN